MRACDESRKGRSRLTSPSNLDAQNRNGSRTHGSYTPNKRQRTPNEQTKLGELRQKTSSARQEPTPDSGYDEPISLPTPASSRTTKQVYIDLTQKDAKEVIDLTLDDDDAPLGAHTDAPARLAPQRNNATTEGNPRPKRSLEVVGDSTSESSSKRRRIASKPAGLEHVDERWCKALEEASSWEKDSVAERGVRPYLDIMKRPGAKAVESFDASTNEININKPYIWNGGTCVDVARYSLRDNIFNHMLSDENNTTGKIYDSGNELRALPEADTDKGEIQPVTKLMVAFSAPNPESALSLIDLKNIPNVKVRIPRLLRDLTHNEYPSRCSADINLTAKHCCIDLHIDDGLAVFSECDAPKLWVFFPPTPENVDKYYAKYDQLHKINSLWTELEEPSFGMTLKNEAMYIPTGWIHATYALENCAVVGTQWATPDCLNITTNCLVHDVKPRVRYGAELVSIRDNKLGLTPFLRSLSHAHRLYAEDDDTDMLESCIDALRQICPKKMGGIHLSRLKELDKNCADCEEVAGAGPCEGCAGERLDLLQLAELVKYSRTNIRQDVPPENLVCSNRGCKLKDGILGHLPVFQTK